MAIQLIFQFCSLASAGERGFPAPAQYPTQPEIFVVSFGAMKSELNNSIGMIFVLQINSLYQFTPDVDNEATFAGKSDPVSCNRIPIIACRKLELVTGVTVTHVTVNFTVTERQTDKQTGR